MIHFTLFMFQMYSSSLIFQQKEPKNHSNSMNKHKNVEGDQIKSKLMDTFGSGVVEDILF